MTCDTFGRPLKSAKTQKKKVATASDLLNTFNTWSIKREQPDSKELLIAFIERAMSAQAAVPFVLYWGKGLRSGLAQPDRQCMDFINTVSQRIAELYAPGASMTLILTDTHARLNGHPEEAIESYFSQVAAAAAERGFKTRFLSDVVAESHIEGAEPCEVQSELMSRLAHCASKWYRGEETSDAGARRYFEMNMVEKRAVETAFPDSVFVTFNGGEMRELFPSALPIFYMYSLKRGTSVKPWFMPEPVDGQG